MIDPLLEGYDMKLLMDFLKSHLMEKLKFTALVNLYSLMKLPLLAFITPEFAELTHEKCVVKVRLGYRASAKR